jgi:hypothetical protein
MRGFPGSRTNYQERLGKYVILIHPCPEILVPVTSYQGCAPVYLLPDTCLLLLNDLHSSVELPAFFAVIGRNRTQRSHALTCQALWVNAMLRN